MGETETSGMDCNELALRKAKLMFLVNITMKTSDSLKLAFRYHCNRPWRPIELRNVKDLVFFRQRLSDLRAGGSFVPRKIFWCSFPLEGELALDAC
jgi:hypothetical protein